MTPKKILDYHVIKLIGKGTFSKVYLAQKNSQSYAIKVSTPQKNLPAEKILESLRFEFWVLRNIQHPHVVSISDFGALEDGSTYLIEEFLDGVPCHKFFVSRPFSACEPLIIQILQALSAIHEWNVIHSDLKPENIFIASPQVKPAAKLLDFGLARLMRSEENEKVSGTLATMAPEILLGQKANTQSDLYSLGVTLYHALTGKNPFISNTAEMTIQNHLSLKPQPLGLLRDDVPPQWDQVVQKMLAKNPDERPPSAEQILGIITRKKFMPVPTEFMHRQKELECVPEIETSLKQNQKLALRVNGPPGIGASRFLKEIFYRLIARQPKNRAGIHLDLPHASPQNRLILLLERKKPPLEYPVKEITLAAFTKEETHEWLKKIFRLDEIPPNFLDGVMRLTQGNPKHVWDLLTGLARQDRLTDAAGHVSKTTLKLADFKKIFTETTELSRNFDYLHDKLIGLVRKRAIATTDPLWDHVLKLASEDKNKTMKAIKRAQIHLLQGACLIDHGKLDRAKELLLTALELFQDEPAHVAEKLRTQNFLAYISLRQGKTAEAVQQYEKTSSTTEKLGPVEKKQITNLDLGLAYYYANRYTDAVKQLEKEIAFYRQNNLPEHEISCLYTLALTHQKLNRIDQAKTHYEQVKTLAQKMRNTTFLLRALNGLGNTLRDTPDWSHAIEAYTEALETALAVKDLSAASASAQNLGSLKGDHGFLKEAATDLENALKYAQTITPQYAYEKTLICRSLEYLGTIFSKQDKKREAEECFNRAWHMAESDSDLADFRFWVLSSRCRHWIGIGDTDKFNADFARLNFYAQTEEQKKTRDEIKKDFQKKRSALPSPAEKALQSELNILLELNKELVGESNLDSLLEKILKYAVELSGSELGVILLSDQKGRLVPQKSLNADLDENLSEISTSVADQVLNSGKIIKAADAIHDREFNQFASVMALGLKSILGVPIVFRGKTLGVLYLSHRFRAGAYDKHSTNMIKAFADQAALAIKNQGLLDFYKKTSEDLSEDLLQTERDLAKARETFKQVPKYLRDKYAEANIITAAPRMMRLLEQAEKLAATNLSVIIHGETGSGKELVARFIHARSRRKKEPFMAVNCGALPANLVESELFGHKKGAFTGADRDKPGLIEAAHGGTLFLDEITDLPLDIQVKFLRVLQEKEVIKVGETRPHPVDIRVLAASHKTLKDAVAQKRFREDLYFRLAGMETHVPPLRERSEDIPLLSRHFLKLVLSENDRTEPHQFHPSLLKAMLSHSWPCNMRELKNFVDVGASLCTGKILKKTDYPDYLIDTLSERMRLKQKTAPETATGWYDPRKTWKEHEFLIYASALHHFDFDAQKTAQSLGVGIATVYKWMRENRLRETVQEWKDTAKPYRENIKFSELRANIFKQAAKKFPGHPYRAAKELDVAPVTFYRWSR